MIEKTNIADLHTPSGEPLTPSWFDLSNYDLEPDWSRGQPEETMRVYRPTDDAESPLDFA